MKIYRITADDHTLEKTYRHKFDAEQSLKKAGYENEGDDDWSKPQWAESGESITVIYARIEEVEVL